jgi:hypothetical protein
MLASATFTRQGPRVERAIELREGESVRLSA